MRSLKKLISIALVLTMVLGSVAMAFAATEDTMYPDAVKVMTSLKVITGDGKGNLNLKETLSREQASKIIAYFLVGEKAANAVKDKSTFSDVGKDRWSSGYISICTKAGVIDGYNKSTFGPDNSVTGLQFGKMLLAILGYKGLTGSEWVTNTMNYMNAAGLTYFMGPITRDQACQMCFEALKAYVVDSNGVVMKNSKETDLLYSDGLMQLGELLYPKLIRVKTDKGYVWKLDGKEIGVSEVLDTIQVDDKSPDSNLGKYTYPLIGLRFGLKSFDAEDIILFSKSKDGNFSPYLTAKSGETIYVKANRFTINLFKLFNGDLPETLVSNTTAKQFTVDDLINFSGSVNLPLMKVGMSNVSLTIPTLDSFSSVAFKALDTGFKNAVLNVIDHFEEQTGRNVLIELKLEKEASKYDSAIYSFTMPDRMVSGYDFSSGNIKNITFVNTTVFSKTIKIKVGEFGESKQITVKPFSIANIMQEATDENIYYSTAADTRFLIFRDLDDAMNTNLGININNLETKLLRSLSLKNNDNEVIFLTSALLSDFTYPFLENIRDIGLKLR